VRSSWSSTNLQTKFAAASFAVALLWGVASAQVPDVVGKGAAVAATSRSELPNWVKSAQNKNSPVTGVTASVAASSGGFEQNLGQVEGDARYIARTDLGIVLLRPGVMTSVIAPPESVASASSARPDVGRSAQ